MKGGFPKHLCPCPFVLELVAGVSKRITYGRTYQKGLVEHGRASAPWTLALNSSAMIHT